MNQNKPCNRNEPQKRGDLTKLPVRRPTHTRWLKIARQYGWSLTEATDRVLDGFIKATK